MAAKSTPAPKSTVKIVKASDVHHPTASKVYTHTLKDGSSVTATECEGGFRLSTDGKVYTSLSGAASAYLIAQGKSGVVSGPKFFGASSTPREAKALTLADVRKLIERALSCTELTPMHKKTLEAVRDAMPAPAPKDAKIEVVLPDGRKVMVPARFAR